MWDLGCQSAFEALKGALVAALVFIWHDFKKQFCLDLDWSPKGVGAILSQKEGKMERVIAYACKGLTSAQRKFLGRENVMRRFGVSCISGSICTEPTLF